MKPELTLRAIVLAILLTVILSASNAYLALKLGLLTSASIPAAILSMGILRFFKNSSILEHNAVQTAASAGEAVAGGIVYTIPAMIIIHYWYHFDYWTNVCIAALGGVLGVLFSIPLRRTLVNDPSLKFPEAVVIAQLLNTSLHHMTQFRHLVFGGCLGALIEWAQSGAHYLFSQWSYWWIIYQRIVFGVSIGFSATLFGAGFLIGQEMAISLLIGAFISSGIGLPLDSFFHPALLHTHHASEIAMLLWTQDIRYLGIGAMLSAGVLTLIQLIRPLLKQMMSTVRRGAYEKKLASDRDLPTGYLVGGIGISALALSYFFYSFFGEAYSWYGLIIICVLYVLFVGFLFSIITAYFSGMVGVSASPGSSIVIAGLLFAAWMLLSVMRHYVPGAVNQQVLLFFEALTILLGSMVTGIAAIANDNSQDLKVGQLVGATPWKQQLMLLLGVVVASLVIPWVMEVLFNRYGIAGVVPHQRMPLSDTLPSPVAALLAAMTIAVFQEQLPWMMLGLGALSIIACLFIYYVFRFNHRFNVSLLGVAVGMYLPLTTSIPLIVGGGCAYLIGRKKQQHTLQQGTMIACGLVSGAALMDIVICAFKS